MSWLKRAQAIRMILGYFSCTTAHNTLTGKEVIPSFSGSHAHGFSHGNDIRLRKACSGSWRLMYLPSMTPNNRFNLCLGLAFYLYLNENILQYTGSAKTNVLCHCMVIVHWQISHWFLKYGLFGIFTVPAISSENIFLK